MTHTTGQNEANAALTKRAVNSHASLLAALHTPDLDQSHNRLSALLENEDAENDDIRDAALDLVASLQAFQETRRAAIAKAEKRP